METRAFVIDPELAAMNMKPYSPRPQRESPRAIVAALELKQARERKKAEASLPPHVIETRRMRERFSPKEIVAALERRYGLARSSDVEPLTARELELYSDEVIKRPDDYDARYCKYLEQKIRADKAYIAAHRRWPKAPFPKTGDRVAAA